MEEDCDGRSNKKLKMVEPDPFDAVSLTKENVQSLIESVQKMLYLQRHIKMLQEKIDLEK